MKKKQIEIEEVSYSDEQVQDAVDVLVSKVDDYDTGVINWFVNKKLPLSLNSLRKLSSLKMDYDVKINLASAKINDEIAKNLRRSSSTDKMTLTLLSNSSISFDLRRKFLSKSFVKLILNHTGKSGRSYYERYEFDFDLLKKKMPKDIVDEIEKVMVCKEIIE